MSARKAGRRGNLGDKGEDHFQGWCADNDLAWSRPMRDRLGWDHLVEFKPTISVRIGLDAQNDAKKVLVQVKATDRPQTGIVGKLSALKHLVDADMPAFVVRLDYAGQRLPQSAVLLHIGGSQIEGILRRVRELESKGRLDLHNVQFRPSMEGAVPLLADGSDLAERFESFVPRGMAAYVADKSAFRQSCGYDELAFLASVQLAPGVGLSDIADLQIARIPHLRISSATMHKRRFGITLDKETEHFGAAVLTIDVTPMMQGWVAASSEQRASSVELPVDVYCSDPDAGLGMPKMRFTNVFFDATRESDGSLHVSFTLREEERHELRRLVPALKLGAVLSESDAKLKFTTDRQSVEIPLPTPQPHLAALRHMHGFAELFAAALFRHKPHLQLDVTVDEIEAALEANERVYSLLVVPGFCLSFGVEKSAEQAVVSVAPAAVMLLAVCMSLKSVIYHAVLRIDAASVVVEDGEVHFTGGQPHVLEDGVVLESEAAGLGGRLEKRTQHLRSLENSQGRLVVGLHKRILGLDGVETSAITGAISW